jgi:hypothetical protein
MQEALVAVHMIKPFDSREESCTFDWLGAHRLIGGRGQWTMHPYQSREENTK